MDKQAAIPLREFRVAMRYSSAGFAVRAAQFTEDFAAIHRLVADNWRATGPRTSRHPGDVYWRAYRKPDDWYVFLDEATMEDWTAWRDRSKIKT